jgi:signal transduction histidine kinase
MTAHVATCVRNSAHRMAGVISQLLDYTRTQIDGGLPLELAPTNLEAVCREVLEELQLARGAEARFQCEYSGDLDGVWDAERLAQVVSNLAGNALEHGAEGAPIRLRARDEGAEVSLAVSNRGRPIPPDVLPFIFEPFRRARPAEVSAGGVRGLGLGLYISRQIVLAHGGTIDVRSNEREGTTFSIRLPRRRSRG